MTPKQYISRLKADPRTRWIAFSWVCFMMFFTFTDLVVASVYTDIEFQSVFRGLHIRGISLFVNFGLIIMLLFDYSVKYKTMSKEVVWTAILGLMLCISIYFHCRKVTANAHSALIYPLCLDYFSIILFVVFMILLFIIKTFVEFSAPVKVSEQN